MFFNSVTSIEYGPLVCSFQLSCVKMKINNSDRIIKKSQKCKHNKDGSRISRGKSQALKGFFPLKFSKQAE